ncbi:MAG: hypothetical protein JO237_05730, partial [Pseudolabrys sp.]|nr:hypothetical protein [Pseudolabrys sp.]
VDFAQDFFGREAFLTVSGQLNIEAYCLALTKVYTFGPTFRAENSNTSRHLAEFWMIEPEIAFADLSDNAVLAEALLKYTFAALLKEREEDLAFFDQRIEKGLVAKLEGIVGSEFVHMDYGEAIGVLVRANDWPLARNARIGNCGLPGKTISSPEQNKTSGKEWLAHVRRKQCQSWLPAARRRTRCVSTSCTQKRPASTLWRLCWSWWPASSRWVEQRREPRQPNRCPDLPRGSSRSVSPAPRPWRRSAHFSTCRRREHAPIRSRAISRLTSNPAPSWTRTASWSAAHRISGRNARSAPGRKARCCRSIRVMRAR